MILNVRRGDKATYSLTLLDAAETALDLTSMSVAFTAKAGLLDPDIDAVIVKDETDGIVIGATPTDGTITLTLLPEDTEGLADATRLYWDIQVDDGIGGVTTGLSGKLVVSADVTLTASATS